MVSRLPRSWAAWALVALAACGPAPTPPLPPAPTATVPPPGSADPAAGIVPDPSAVKRVEDDVRFLASPELAGRGTGEPGARAAAEMEIKRFAELKLAPLGDATGTGRGYLQSFRAQVGAKVSPPTVALKPAPKGAPLDAAAAVTCDGSASAEVSGEAVFVGYGITANALGWDDYAGDLEGKIAVILDGSPTLPATSVPVGTPHTPGPVGTPHSPGPVATPGPHDPRPDSLKDFGAVRYKVRTAREHKVAGVVLVAAGDELPAVPSDATSMGIPCVVLKRSAAAPLFAQLKQTDAEARAVQKAGKPRPVGKTTVALGTKIEPLSAEAWNVVGSLSARDGSKHANEWVVVGAHYDHLGHGGTSASRAPGSHEVHPGADDNASGSAMMLEVARRIATGPRLERNVAFIGFGAEEIGAIGSRYWVEHPPIPIGSIVAMINADMVGRMRDKRLLVDGMATSPGWPDIVKAASKGLGLDLTFGGEGLGASDHASFTALRIPVTFLFTGVHDDYHKPSDTADKLDYRGVELAATLAARLAVLVSERPDRLAFVDAPPDPHRGMRGGFKVSLGTLPDYAFQGKGMRLSGVRADAPAARAGLTAGDVIVKIGAHDVTNVHDFMFALGDLEPGREVTVEIERNGARTSVKVIPAPGR